MTLLDAAAAAFLKNGFDRTSMSQISDLAGCSKGTLYSYFTSKEELFYEAVLGSPDDECQAVVLSLDESRESAHEVLLEFGINLLTMLYSPRFRVLRRLAFCDTSEARLGRVVYENGVKRYQGMVGDFLTSAMQQGKLREADPAVATEHLLGLLESELLIKFLLQVREDITEEELREIAKRAIDVFWMAYKQ